MHYLIFTLTMPNRGSWNNKWSGDSCKYVVAKKFSKKEFEALPDIVNKSHMYSWNDGWTALVSVELVTTAKEKNSAIKNSNGFCGYDWMITSLLKHGKILKDCD